MDFDKIINRKGTDSAKWEVYGDALPMWIADMDFIAPEPVLEILRQRVEHGILGYSILPDELIEVVRAWLRDQHGWEVEAEAISVLPGVMPGVNMAGRAVGAPGDGILIQSPVYYPFFKVPQNSSRVLQVSEIPQGKDRYEIDFDAFEDAFDERTRLFVLCNPHNPIGRVFERDELERMAEICLKKDVIICSDEIHSDLLFDGRRHIPIATLSPEVAARTVTTFAPSKTFNIPGMGIAFMVIQNPELKKKVEAAGAGLVHVVSGLSFAAAIAAYRDGKAWLDALLDYLRSNRDYLVNFVRTRLPGVDMVNPEATYLGWLNCRQAGLTPNPHKFFLEHAGVAMNEGATFGPGGEGFVRLNFGCPHALLVEALERMERALGENTD